MASFPVPIRSRSARCACSGSCGVAALHGRRPELRSDSASSPAASRRRPRRPRPRAEAKAAAAPTRSTTARPPASKGLTRAIAKAHGAVAASQQNAQQLETSQQASGDASAAAARASGTARRGSRPPSRGGATRRRSRRATARTLAARSAGAPAERSASHGRAPSQVAVEDELAPRQDGDAPVLEPEGHGRRQAVRTAALARSAGGSKARSTVHAALADQVDVFGTITEVVQSTRPRRPDRQPAWRCEHAHRAHRHVRAAAGRRGSATQLIAETALGQLTLDGR